tara:strand:- start:426 stop:734 length:309 start_codon:yes stop_codon:yes gene_type:complete
MRIFFLLTLIVLFTNPSISSEMVKGLGVTKCTTFNDSSIEEKIIYMSWMAGYISSHNVLKKKLHAKNLSFNRSKIWIESYCYNNPEKTFKNAVDLFINEFTK